MPPARRKPQTTDTTETREDTTTVSTTDTAALLREAARNALAYHVGHTGNNKIHLSVGDWSPWAPTMAEYVGAQVEGTTLYTGPARKETKPGKWEEVDLRAKGDHTHAEARTWYAELPRLESHIRHAAGCDAMGWEPTDPVAVWQPGRSDLYAVSVAEDPAEQARMIATGQTARNTADGLNANERRKLDKEVRAILAKARKNAPWGGSLADLGTQYGAAAILASVERITEGQDDSGKWIAAMGKVLRRD